MVTIDLDGFELVPTAPGLRVSFPLHSAAGTASTATVLFELDPGAELGVHTDSAEELLVVLRGAPTLRTSDGERVLAEGDVVHFPAGPDGAHGLRNDSDAPARFLLVSDRPTPEVVEYPDLGQITAQARTGSQTGEQLWLIHDVRPADSVDD